MIEIVIPKNNEKKFIEVAKKLGIKEIMFLYGNIPSQKKAPKSASGITFKTGILADPKMLGTKHKMFQSKGQFVAVKSSQNNRNIIDGGFADLIFDFELDSPKDFMHHRASGINQVFAKTMAQNKIQMGFSVSSILNSKNRGMLLGRVKQNLMLCKKYKVKTVFASFTSNPYEMRSDSDLASFLKILGFTQTNS